MSQSSEEPDITKVADQLNVRAYLALSRVEANPVRHIVNLLRSEVPIDPILRNAFADAFEKKRSKDILSFEVVGKEAGASGLFAERRHRFFRDMDIARYVSLMRSAPNNMTRRAAQEAAALNYLVSYATCDAAVEAAKKMQKWVTAYYAELPSFFKNLTPDQQRHQMESEYFYLSDAGRLEEGRRFT